MIEFEIDSDYVFVEKVIASKHYQKKIFWKDFENEDEKWKQNQLVKLCIIAIFTSVNLQS